nr:hypothetical protein [Hypnea sp.]
MLTYLIQLSFFNEYIIAPYTCLHYFNSYKKFFIIFFYLCLFYYLNILYSIIAIILILGIIINLPKPSLKSILNLDILLLALFFIINIFLYITNEKKYQTYSNNSMHFVSPCQSTRNNRKYTFSIKPKIILRKKKYSIIIPEFLIRSISIPITSYLCLKLLFLTTKYEYIIIYIISCIQGNKNSTNKKILFIFTISSQFVLLIAHKISLLIFSIILRNMNIIFNFNQKDILFFTFIEILNFTHLEIKRISYTMYIKKINHTNFSFIDLYA